MAYIINKSNGSVLVSLQDGTLDTSTSVGLVGRNYTGYGEIQNENFLFLLENFANISPPSRALPGQTWFDTNNSKLTVYSGVSWVPVGSATVSLVQPLPVIGSFWVKESTNQLYVYTNIGWVLVGPEAAEGFGTTKAESRILRDISNQLHAVIAMVVNGEVISIFSKTAFIISDDTPVSGFSELSNGLTLSTTSIMSGSILGNSSTSSRLETARTINNVIFDGQSNITLKSATTSPLVRGDHLVGNAFDGSVLTTWSVDASPENIIGKVVVRNSQGNFSSNEITANKFIGPLSGNVTIFAGTSTFDKIICNNLEGPEFSGNAATASRLSPGRTINSVLFDGSENIIIATAAGTLTGVRLASSVIESSLNVVGTLTSLNVLSPGITVGSANAIKIHTPADIPTIEDINGQGISIVIKDVGRTGDKSTLQFLSAATVLSMGGTRNPSLVPDANEVFNLGAVTTKFGTVYAKTFDGEATSALYADLAENYVADRYYEPGTVLEFGGDFEVTASTERTQRIAGVVSLNPAYLMNSQCKGVHVASIALQGRVPCKVIGPIRKGDMLVSAGNGIAIAHNNPAIGSVIGKSLENFVGYLGTVEVAVGKT